MREASLSVIGRYYNGTTTTFPTLQWNVPKSEAYQWCASKCSVLATSIGRSISTSACVFDSSKLGR